MTAQPCHCWKPEAKHVPSGASIPTRLPPQPSAQLLGRRQAFPQGAHGFRSRDPPGALWECLSSACPQQVPQAGEQQKCFSWLRRLEVQGPGVGRFGVSRGPFPLAFSLCVLMCDFFSECLHLLVSPSSKYG